MRRVNTLQTVRAASPFFTGSSRRARRTAPRGFTLTEVLLTMAVFSFVVLAMVNLHIFGLKLNKMVDVKLQATEDARRALSQLARDIRGAGVVKIGTGDASSFAEAGFNVLQQGNAIQIYPIKTNAAAYMRYYLDPADSKLKRISSSSPTPSIVSAWVTNSMIFTSEDCGGNVLSNNFNNRVIGIDLEFYKLDNPMIQFGSGNYYDYYRLQTRVTRRALE